MISFLCLIVLSFILIKFQHKSTQNKYEIVMIIKILLFRPNSRKLFAMAANRQLSHVELLLEHLNLAERSINLNYLQSRKILDNSIRLIRETKTELRKHLECHYTTNSDNPKYTMMPLDKLTETLIHSNC